MEDVGVEFHVFFCRGDPCDRPVMIALVIIAQRVGDYRSFTIIDVPFSLSCFPVGCSLRALIAFHILEDGGTSPSVYSLKVFHKNGGHSHPIR